MVSDSGLHDLFEGIVDSSPHPAVDVNALHSKPDPLLCEVVVLQKANKKKKGYGNKNKPFAKKTGQMRKTAMMRLIWLHYRTYLYVM